PGCSDLVAEVQVVGVGVVEIDGALHQPQSEQPGVEVDVALRVAGDRRDVMNSEYARHRASLVWLLSHACERQVAAPLPRDLVSRRVARAASIMRCTSAISSSFTRCPIPG